MRVRLSFVLCAGLIASVFAIAAIPVLGQNKVEDQIKDSDKAFCAATAARGLEGWVSFFAPDASLPPEHAMADKAAIRQRYLGLFAHKDLEFKWWPEHAEVFAAGSLGYTVGRYTRSFVGEDGRRLQQSGSYITVWQRQNDGSWKIVGDFGAADPQLPANRTP